VLRSERLALAHGACVIVELAEPDDAEAALAQLAAAEQQRAAELAPVRRRDFIAGRTALRLALAEAPAAGAAMLSDDRGAPVLPAGWVGSLSHKGGLAAALVAPAGAGHVGVDLERAVAPRADIARRILTPREQAALDARAPGRGAEVTLRFAIKEAIYKAIDPYVRRYVGFTEVELELDVADAVVVTTALPFAIEARWRAHGGHWLATARAVPR
jgi:enterobactin synthetase component D / holo-[acyl-carrier protein] synthase